MEVILCIAYTLLFLFLLQKMRFFEVPGISRRQLSVLFLLKIGAGLMLWAIYTYYYTDRATADIYKYFDDSAVLMKVLHQSPSHFFRILFGIHNNTPEFYPYYSEMHYWARGNDSSIYNDSHTIIRFNTLVRFFSLGYFNVHTIFMCFLSMTGLTALLKACAHWLPGKERPLTIFIFLIPSVLFWGSGVLKEGILFFAIGMLIYHCAQGLQIRSIVIALLMLALLGLSRFYVWISILPGIIFLVWDQRFTQPSGYLKMLIILVAFGLIGSNLSRFTPYQDPFVTLAQKQSEFRKLADGEMQDSELKKIPVAGSRMEIPILEPNISSFVRNSPQAIFNCLFRPLPREIKNPFLLMAFGENFLLLLLLAGCLFYALPLNQWNWKLLLFCGSFLLLQFLIIGETTPILGALTRYRCIALPFFGIGAVAVIDPSKLGHRWPRIQKMLFPKN